MRHYEQQLYHHSQTAAHGSLHTEPTGQTYYNLQPRHASSSGQHLDSWRPCYPNTTDYSYSSHPNTTPNNTYHPSTAPNNTYHPSTTPNNTYHPSTAPNNTYHPSTAPNNTYHPSTAPNNTYHPSATPNDTYHPSTTPSNTYHPSTTPNNTWQPLNTLTIKTEFLDRSNPNSYEEASTSAEFSPSASACQPSPSYVNEERGPKLWEFLLALLDDPASNPSIIRWENQAQHIFRLINPQEVALRWGQRRPKHNTLPYDYFARALRWLLLVTCGYWWLLVALDGYWWLLVAPHGYWWLLMATGGSSWLLVAPDGYWRLLVAAGGSSWLLVAPHDYCRLLISIGGSRWLLVAPDGY
ncbi:ETV5-related protein Ets96B-like [Homarus americanus]|uniref:ETV5-related protein Ets96B-like n=1 Tax=Homarus americanus TaxID=6706 RepID=A0A8J5NAD1_HOMAM|nr:ETV5-related protein Ets96B-like [Homarus americanus]